MARCCIVLACVALLLAGCRAETDRDHYEVGEPGTVRLHNTTRIPLYLEGCSAFAYEKQVGGRWLPQGPALTCIWEGLARPLAPGTALEEPIETSMPGTWRVRYRVGLGCSDAAPLGEADCAVIGELTSNAYEVAASECVVSGCSGQICDEEPRLTTCEWQPSYACYRSARCGRFGPDGSCAWEPTPELLACLDDSAHATW
jgi:hypothetical protein